ncbi:MAG TPA: ATP-dependent metalloprotease, partial [Gammaproteobacteria bacterium]|nr:ATP-dependent metalloprotease [Gammaproteobacteria bacterium]
PKTDRLSLNLEQIESKLSQLFGGRIAEELIFGKDKVTTGAGDDIKKATKLCRDMVTKWGLSERLGPLVYGDEDGEVFLGHSVTKTKEISEQTAEAIDEEVRRIVDKTYKTAKDILEKNIDKLHAMAAALIKYETLDAEQIRDVMEGREPREPKEWVSSDKGGPKGKSDSKPSSDPSEVSVKASDALGDQSLGNAVE